MCTGLTVNLPPCRCRLIGMGMSSADKSSSPTLQSLSIDSEERTVLEDPSVTRIRLVKIWEVKKTSAVSSAALVLRGLFIRVAWWSHGSLLV